MDNKVYQVIASKLQAMKSCEETGKNEMAEKHYDCILEVIKDFLPSGSGFDNGTGMYPDFSSDNKLVFESGYHMMNEEGHYKGWIEFYIIITPSFTGFNLKIKYCTKTKTKKEFKDLHDDYIGDTFYQALNTEILDEYYHKMREIYTK